MPSLSLPPASPLSRPRRKLLLLLLRLLLLRPLLRLLGGLAFVAYVPLLLTQRGWVSADTKTYLYLDPSKLMSRAWSMWDPSIGLGTVTHQNVGYLWPMGPFHALGFLADVPAWVVQRSWMALVLCVAFVGMALLVRVLGVRSDLACIVAGFAFALSPRMLTVLGPSSIEVWPTAVAPWVLLPLVIGSRRGSPVRAAALAALAVAMVGGVNAAATSAVLPLGALWLLVVVGLSVGLAAGSVTDVGVAELLPAALATAPAVLVCVALTLLLFGLVPAIRAALTARGRNCCRWWWACWTRPAPAP